VEGTPEDECIVLSIVWSVFVVITVAAAVVDVATYRIPNTFVLALLAIFLVIAAIHWREVAWLNHLGAGLLVLGAGIVLYSIRQMGAGDVKLLAVVGLWAGIFPLIFLMFWVSVCGFAGMMIILLLRLAVPRLRPANGEGVQPALPRVLTKGKGIPYGIGIGPGAIIASFYFPAWLWAQ
jgi:prepilin peptidase CpaA